VNLTNVQTQVTEDRKKESLRNIIPVVNRETLTEKTLPEGSIDSFLEIMRQQRINEFSEKATASTAIVIRGLGKETISGKQKYRGVTQNGKKWQVHITKGDFRKIHGQILEQAVAARYYDKYSICLRGS
jgi:hypothetical protein